MSNEVHNVKLIGGKHPRILHLVGDITSNNVTLLINDIININEEEVTMTEYCIAETKRVLEAFDIVKLDNSCGGNVGLMMKKKPVEPIELYINSNGGSLMDGLALINAIKTSDVPVHAFVSIASSMATVVALACDQVYTYPDTLYMIHELAYGLDGKLRAHKEEVIYATKLQEIIDNIILSNSEIPKEDLKAHYDDGKDWRISGDDIRDYGMTNEIIILNEGRDTTFKQ